MYLTIQNQQENGKLIALEIGTRSILNLVSFSAKFCQNILSDLEIECGFTQLNLHSRALKQLHEHSHSHLYLT